MTCYTAHREGSIALFVDESCYIGPAQATFSELSTLSDELLVMSICFFAAWLRTPLSSIPVTQVGALPSNTPFFLAMASPAFVRWLINLLLFRDDAQHVENHWRDIRHANTRSRTPVSIIWHAMLTHNEQDGRLSLQPV